MNDSIRRKSSSGGVFHALACNVINEGGVVFGARFDSKWGVEHSYTETISGLAFFQGSKYVQSNIGTAYTDAERFLKAGRKVLFSGTPCQLAGLRLFLRKDYGNLLLSVDVACHGVPSPAVWQAYLAGLLDKIGKHGSLAMESITKIDFRDIRHGWNDYGFSISGKSKPGQADNVLFYERRVNNDRAISELEKSTSGIEADRARRILTRYTMASFPSASEWRKWYDTYRDRFFFTESGGWKFMIDGQPDLPGNDYYLYNSRIAEQRTASTGTATSDESPVLATLNIENDIRGGRTLTLRIKIHPGYHIYADVAGDDPYVPTTLTLSLPEGLTAGEWTASRPGQFGTSGSTIYEDEAVYTCPVAGNTAGDVSCTVSYQCCDAHICLPPVKKTLRVSI